MLRHSYAPALLIQTFTFVEIENLFYYEETCYDVPFLLFNDDNFKRTKGNRTAITGIMENDRTNYPGSTPGYRK